MANENSYITQQQAIVRELSEKIVNAQKPIRILDSLKWDESVKRDFFKNKFKELPPIDASYYQKEPLHINVAEKTQEFKQIEVEVQSKLGKVSPLSQLMLRMCGEYRVVLQLLEARGTERFGLISQDLFGSATDALYVGGPTLTQLANILHGALPSLLSKTETDLDVKCFTGQQTADILQERLSTYFNDPNEPITVEVSDNIVADAAAGAEVIRIKRNAMFSQRDIRILEVHEGWVHLGTTLNGRQQPFCSFLSKGTPSSTTTQEGLAVITELFTMSAYPARIKRICDRITAVNMVQEGANFIDIFNYLREENHSDEASYSQAVRVFRGGLPDGSCGPFTKDVSYSKGFVLIYNYIRLAVKHGLVDQVPLLFVGKTTLQDLPLFTDLIEQGLLLYPKYIPPQFRDLAALSSWLSFSLFMNQLDLKQMEMDFKGILRI
jgi:uncharacterized protein (TIGR02421 family)